MIYAHVVAGTVAELFTPPAGVSISDCFNAALVWVDVTAVSPAPQPGWTATEAAGVWTFAAPAASPAPTLAQQATAAMGAGLAITSTATPALDATYPVDAQTQSHIQAEIISVMLNGTFADGTASIVWSDVAGVSHPIGGVTEFKAFASAIAAYVAALFKVINGTLGALPAATVTIP